MKILSCTLTLFLTLLASSLQGETETPSPQENTPPSLQPKPGQPAPFPWEEDREVKEPPPSFAMQLLHMFTTLGILLGVILLASWLLKKMMRTRIVQANQTSAIKILEQRAVSNKTSISLIEIRGKEVAIAESTNGVTLLSPLAFQGDRELSTFGRGLQEKLEKKTES